ncbi:MAG: DUF6603 domain-containing protein, partial [Bacteroidia bacterium]
YEAGFYINVGCSVDMGLFTLNLSAGANLYIWGPEFGGEANVDLDVVSFTIAFGAAATVPQVVGWNNFKSSFLPADTQVSQQNSQARLAAEAEDVSVSNIIKASAAKGLLQSDISDYAWVLDPDNFEIVTNSTIPANTANWATATGSYPVSSAVIAYNVQPPDTTNQPWLYLSEDTLRKTYSPTEVWNPTLNIAPMKLNNVSASHNITLSENGTNITSFAVEPVLTRASASLWAPNNPNPNPNDDRFVVSALSGFSIKPVPRTPSFVNNVPLLQLVFASGFSTGFIWQQAVTDTNYTVTSSVNSSEELLIGITGAYTANYTDTGYTLSTLVEPWVTAQRNTILTDLVTNGFGTLAPDQVNITVFATETALTDWPMVELIGSEQVAAA